MPRGAAFEEIGGAARVRRHDREAPLRGVRERRVPRQRQEDIDAII